ncbi:hypothetical protein C8A01DRAFT_19418 [Parachaetomium inaequale]|uniref:Rhodopsin domain-containing protein n=1 Tax=Parachaetomium inaequale TaxID=2588326 RepID=A0AAN6P8E4_9PEZI|nr:hypothetical protein C8A01DRAFT_19418 [Parachaetomium inaequale]
MADDNGPAMTITMVVCTVVSFIFMCLRLWCKQNMSSKVGFDDAVLALSWALFLVFVVISIQTTKWGLGKHLADADLTLLPNLMYYLPIAQFFAVIAIAVSKSSFILTLLRLVFEPWHKAALWFMLVTINLSMGSISIVQFFLCSVPPTPGCVSSDVVIGLGVFAAGYSAAMDLVLTGFPSLVIWKLQMKRREKVGIIASMSLGVVAGVVGIYKSSTIPAVSRSVDFTHGTAIVLIWLVAEFVATVIACSIPFFRPLLRLVSSVKRSKASSYAMSGMGKGGHSKLGSRTDVVKANPDDPSSYDPGSDKDEQPLNSNSGVVHRTDIFTVEYGNWSGNEGSNNGHSAPGQARREMC